MRSCWRARSANVFPLTGACRRPARPGRPATVTATPPAIAAWRLEAWTTLLPRFKPAAPTGNRYGDAAGHSCMAVAGLQHSVTTLETGSADRLANMHVFAATALNLLLETVSR